MLTRSSLPRTADNSSFGPQKNTPQISYKEYIDTAVSAYGPGRAAKLPTTAGFKVANPIQLSLGPGGSLFASNQNGDLYSLRNTDNDGMLGGNHVFDINLKGLKDQKREKIFDV